MNQQPEGRSFNGRPPAAQVKVYFKERPWLLPYVAVCVTIILVLRVMEFYIAW